MRSHVVVVACVRLQNLSQMHLAQDNDVVHTLTPDRSDQPFGKAILPGRGWCGRLVPDAHGAQSACDDAAIDPVAIADEVVRSLIPGKCFRYLTCNIGNSENGRQYFFGDAAHDVAGRHAPGLTRPRDAPEWHSKLGIPHPEIVSALLRPNNP